MQVKGLAILFTIFGVTSAQKCCPLCPALASPIPPLLSILNSILPECDQNLCYNSPDCGCARPMCYDRPMCSDRPMCYDNPMRASLLDCGCKRCNDELLAPPMLDIGCVKPMCYDGTLLAPISDCRSRCFEELVPPPLLNCGCVKPMCYETPMCYDAPMCYKTPMLGCGCGKLKCKKVVGCGCRPRCNEQLVLPPMRVEVPEGLGYLPSALPVVSSYFRSAVDVGACAGASVPVMSPCICLALATPVCPDIAPLVRSVIL